MRLRTIALPSKTADVPSGVFGGTATVERDRQIFTEFASALDADDLRAVAMFLFGPPSKIVRHDDGTVEYEWGIA